jgi:hypothetical protein
VHGVPHVWRGMHYQATLQGSWYSGLLAIAVTFALVIIVVTAVSLAARWLDARKLITETEQYLRGEVMP